MVTKNLRDRRELMKEYLPRVEGKLEFVSSKDLSDVDDIQEFLT